MSTAMHAAVLHGAKTLRLESYPRPRPEPGMVLLRVRRAGICGSDLHYFQHGSCAAFVPTRPFILGHEFTADIVAVGDGVDGSMVGARTTVNPARACGTCTYCKAGRGNLCRRTIMLGSASTVPPTDGAFAEFVTVRSDQCHLLPPDMDDGIGAMIEPLSVAVHAVKRAGTVSGKRVLVTGGGPIGLLVAMTARAFGATQVVLSEVADARRETALALGADAVLDPTRKDLGEQVRQMVGDGFDVILESSGARPALRQAFTLVRPGGTIVQIGTLGQEDVPLPANLLMTREINLVGSMRYGDVFGEAIQLVARKRIDLDPLITGVLPFADAGLAMQLAADSSRSLKVQLDLRTV